jgi:DNA-binding GntR family transcriptional regulator
MLAADSRFLMVKDKNEPGSPTVSITPIIASPSLVAQGTQALREMILSGVLQPGQRLNEVELSAALGISRPPLREAMQHLSSQGLLRTVARRGAFVPSYTAQDLEDIYAVRIALESHAMRMVARRITNEELKMLRGLLKQSEQELNTSAERTYPDQIDFHRQLMQLTNSPHLIETVTAVDQKIQLARIRSGHYPARAQEALDEHRAIVERLRARDGAGAAEVMTHHLEESLANALRVSDLPSTETPAGEAGPGYAGGEP